MPLIVRHNILGAQVAPPALAPARARRLSALVKRHAPKGRPYIVSIHRRGEALRPTDDTVRLRATWAQTLVGADLTVVITQLPLGGGEGGGNTQAKQIGGAIAIAALAIALPYALPALLPELFVAGSFATAAASGGIVLGASYLVGKITQAKANQTAQSQLYGVAGGGNLPRPGDRIPVGYGSFVAQPDLSQPDFSIYDGEDQLLYKRLTLGLGKYQVHKIEIGTATLWTEDAGVVPPFVGAIGGGGTGERGLGIGGGSSASGGGTDVEIVNPGETSALVPASVYSSPAVGGSELPRLTENPAWAGPFRASPVGQTTSRIQIDFSYPQGVSYQNAAGFFSVLFQYAPCDADNLPTGPWVTLVSEGGEAYTTKGVRNTRIIDVPAGNYVVRGQNHNAEGPSGYLNSATWDGLRSHFPDTIVRPHVTEIAMKIRSGKNLGVTAFGDVWVTATRILPTWNGTAWVDAPTRKAVYAFKDVLQADYGGALADGQVDLARIKFYAGELDQFDTFDGIIRGPVSVVEASNSVLGPIRGESARIGNTWSINRDEQRTVRKHVISRRQIVKGSTSSSFKIARDDGAADVIGEYAPEGDSRRRRDLRVTFGSQSLTPSRVQLVGITDHDHAHHVLTWKAAAAYFRRERRKLTVDRRGRLIGRGDPALVDSWFMSDARTGGIVSRASLTLTLDTAMVVDNATYATLRARDNRQWGPVKVTAGASAYIIILDAGDVAADEDATGMTLADALADSNMEMTTVLVGPIAEQQDGYLIDSVLPQGRDRVAIEAVFDHQSVWDALGEAAPPAPPIPSLGDLVEAAVPVVAWVSARCVQKGVTLTMEWACASARGASSYVVSISYDDGVTWEEAASGLATSGSYPLRGGDGITVAVGAWAISKQGVPGPAVYTNFETFRPLINSSTSNLQVAFDTLDAALQDEIGFQANGAQIAADLAAFAHDRAIFANQDAIARVLVESTTRQTNDESLASQITIVGAALQGAITGSAQADSAIIARVSIAEQNTSAISGRVDTFQSRLDNPATGLTALANASNATVARVTAVEGVLSSQATTINSVSNSINGLTNQVSTEITARQNFDNSMVGYWAVQMSQVGVGANQARVSGVRLIASTGATGAQATQFVFEVDKILFAPPGGDPIGVFVLNPSAGSAFFGLRGDLIIDGTITARSIQVETLDARYFVGGGLSVTNSQSNGGLVFGNSIGSQEKVIVQTTLVLTNTPNGRPLPVLALANGVMSSGNAQPMTCRLRVNGTLIGFATFNPPSANASSPPFSLFGFATVIGNGGRVDAVVQLTMTGGGDSDHVDNSNVGAIAVKA